jgi:hypothetical protein
LITAAAGDEKATRKGGFFVGGAACGSISAAMRAENLIGLPKCHHQPFGSALDLELPDVV